MSPYPLGCPGRPGAPGGGCNVLARATFARYRVGVKTSGPHYTIPAEAAKAARVALGLSKSAVARALAIGRRTVLLYETTGAPVWYPAALAGLAVKLHGPGAGAAVWAAVQDAGGADRHGGSGAAKVA